MSDIFREVDEEVRHERLFKLWRKYGNYVVAAFVAVALGVGGSVGWKQYRLNQRLAEGAEFAATLDLLNEGQPALAAERFAVLADDAGAGYAALARLREAEALAEAGDTDGAFAALERLAADDGADRALRDLAGLLTVLQMIDDGGAPDALEERLEPLMQDGSLWRASARELGGLVAFRRGETARAREIFTGLAADATAPAAVRGRAAEFLAILDGGG